MKEILQHLFERNQLTKAEAKEILIDISKEKYNHYQVATFMAVFQMRSISVAELAGFREALLELAKELDIDTSEAIDLCGTGGDGKNTFNVSTTTAFVLAAMGKRVAKHGNNGVSSVCGSSNVLKEVGYVFSSEQKVLQNQLDECNLTFLHAPLFHPAMKFVAPIRRELGIKTFFNMLGPLVNPLQPKYQSVGVFSLKLQRVYAHLLQGTERKYAVLYDLNGYDEISMTGTTKVVNREGEYLLHALSLSPKEIKQEQIYGGNTIEEAAQIFLKVIAGTCPEEHLSVVAANAAVALSLYHPEKSIDDLYQEARETMLSGKVQQTFDKLLKIAS